MRRPHPPARLPLDPWILTLLGTVGLAALLPARGWAATVAEGVATGAVALLFFLYGARLSTREALDGLRHWRLHLTVLACTFVLFPVLGLAARGLVPTLLTPQLYGGLLFLCLVPSTIQSSIAFTSIARGNVPAAICAGSFSSLAGIVLTPSSPPACSAATGPGSPSTPSSRSSSSSCCPSCWARPCAPGWAVSWSGARRSSATSTAVRSCSSCTPPSARAWPPGSGTRSAPPAWAR